MNRRHETIEILSGILMLVPQALKPFVEYNVIRYVMLQVCNKVKAMRNTNNLSSV